LADLGGGKVTRRGKDLDTRAKSKVSLGTDLGMFDVELFHLGIGNLLLLGFVSQPSGGY